MPEFLTELDVVCVSDGCWKLDAPLEYRSDIAGFISVPAGFMTDFASVPRVPVFFTLFGDRAHREAVLHDYMYSLGSLPSVERRTADEVFLEAMAERGKGFFTRYAMYYGVRLAGWTAWRKKSVFEKL